MRLAMVRDEADVSIGNNDDGINGDAESEDENAGEAVVTDAQIRRCINREAVEFVLGVRRFQIMSGYLQLWIHISRAWRRKRFNREAAELALRVRSLQIVGGYLILWIHFSRCWRPFRFQWELIPS